MNNIRIEIIDPKPIKDLLIEDTDSVTLIETISLKALLDRYIDILTPEEENKLRNFKNSL